MGNEPIIFTNEKPTYPLVYSFVVQAVAPVNKTLMWVDSSVPGSLTSRVWKDGEWKSIGSSSSGNTTIAYGPEHPLNPVDGQLFIRTSSGGTSPVTGRYIISKIPPTDKSVMWVDSNNQPVLMLKLWLVNQWVTISTGTTIAELDSFLLEDGSSILLEDGSEVLYGG